MKKKINKKVTIKNKKEKNVELMDIDMNEKLVEMASKKRKVIFSPNNEQKKSKKEGMNAEDHQPHTKDEQHPQVIQYPKK